jgi:hypothetical protein
MEITEKHKTEIENIISGMECPKDFKCYKWASKSLCKIRILGNGKAVECLEANSRFCHWSFGFGMGHFCNCPLRKFIARNFNR